MSATSQRRSGRCPHCGRLVDLVVLAPEPGAPAGMRYEQILACPHCDRLSLPAGLVKRAVGLALLVPFGILLLGGIGTAGYFVVTMVARRDLHGGFLFLAAVLACACGIGLWKTLPSLRRLLTPGGLLPLGRDTRRGTHQFRGEL